MQKKLLRKIVAGALSVAMVLGMTAVSFAAETGTETGEGSFEGYVSEKVVSVDLPASAERYFDYKMDPEGLIARTEAAKYVTQEGDKPVFEPGATVYFQDTDGNWNSKSQMVTVKNTGTADVDVTMEASVEATDKYDMASASTWTTSAAELYLGLFVDGKEGATAITSTDALNKDKVSYGVKGNAKNFEITTSGTEYAFKPIDGEEDWNSISFGLTGACNTTEGVDWSQLGADDAVDVTVTWKYAERAEGATTPEMLPENAEAGPSLTLSSSGLITFSNLAADQGYKEMTLIYTDGKTYKASDYPTVFTGWDLDDWSDETGGSFSTQMDPAWASAIPGDVLKIEAELLDGTIIKAEAVMD